MTDGRAGDEVAPLGIDRSTAHVSTPRIGSDPVEQLVQKRVELEMGEAGVHDRLHVLDAPARRLLRL